MALTPTHLALQGLFVWGLLPKEKKEYYKKHRWTFLLINLVALLPDIDIFFGIHRGPTHSIILPTFFFLIILILEQMNQSRNIFDQESKYKNYNIKLAAIMYLLHIFLDLGWGPIQLFWPLDSRFYDLTVYFRFSNQAWLFLPLVLVGILPRWTIYSYKEGTNLFFINVSQEERMQIYGEYIDLYIDQLAVQVLIVILWLFVIFIPTIRPKQTKENQSKISDFFTKVYRRINRKFTLFGVFLLFLGLLMGPIIGYSYSRNYVATSSLEVTNSHFDPTLGLIIENKENNLEYLNISSKQGRVDYNLSILLAEENDFNSFFDQFENITQAYYQFNISYTELLASYENLKSVLFDNATYYTKMNVTTDTLTIDVLSLDLPETDTYYLILLADDFDESTSFRYRIEVRLSYTFERTQAKYHGLIFDSLGIFLIVTEQIAIFYKQKRR